MIYEILGKGAASARTAKELCKLLNITPRELTQNIERERKAGKPICASTGTNAGYYIAATQAEMKHYCASLLHREKAIGRTRKACSDTIQELPEVI